MPTDGTTPQSNIIYNRKNKKPNYALGVIKHMMKLKAHRRMRRKMADASKHKQR